MDCQNYIHFADCTMPVNDFTSSVIAKAVENHISNVVNEVEINSVLDEIQSIEKTLFMLKVRLRKWRKIGSK